MRTCPAPVLLSSSISIRAIRIFWPALCLPKRWASSVAWLRCPTSSKANSGRAQHPERRPSKRLKDELDLVRIAENYPQYAPQLPPELRVRLA